MFLIYVFQSFHNLSGGLYFNLCLSKLPQPQWMLILQFMSSKASTTSVDAYASIYVFQSFHNLSGCLYFNLCLSKLPQPQWMLILQFTQIRCGSKLLICKQHESSQINWLYIFTWFKGIPFYYWFKYSFSQSHTDDTIYWYSETSGIEFMNWYVRRGPNKFLTNTKVIKNLILVSYNLLTQVMIMAEMWLLSAVRVLESDLWSFSQELFFIS